jgi:type IV secretory pathway VirB10-like protein
MGKKQLNDQAKGNLKIVGITIGVLLTVTVIVSFFLFGKEKKQQVVLSNTGAMVAGSAPADQGAKAFHDEEYQKKIDEDNRRKATQAIASGGSAVPTLTPPGGQQRKPNDTFDVPESEKSSGYPAQDGKKKEEARYRDPVPGERRRSENGSYDVPPPPKEGETSYVYGSEKGKSGDGQNGAAARADAMMKELNVQWALPTQAIAFSGKERAQANNSATGSATNKEQTSAATAPAATVLIEKGTMCYAVIESFINSDEQKAMVSGTLASCEGARGKLYNGARIFGNIERSEESVLVRFTTMNHAKKGYTIDAVAFDEMTGRGALSGDVDRHTFVRYWLPAITEIMAGWGAASSRDNSSTTINLTGATTSQGEISDKSKFAVAIGKSGETVNKIAQDSLKGKEITVKIPNGVGVGLLFLGNVTASPVGM